MCDPKTLHVWCWTYRCYTCDAGHVHITRVTENLVFWLTEKQTTEILLNVVSFHLLNKFSLITKTIIYQNTIKEKICYTRDAGLVSSITRVTMIFSSMDLFLNSWRKLTHLCFFISIRSYFDVNFTETIILLYFYTNCVTHVMVDKSSMADSMSCITCVMCQVSSTYF